MLSVRIIFQVSHLEDLSAQQTSSNFALTVEIESLKEKADEIMVEKENLENQIERTSFSHAEEKIKLESTLAQQTKLIDFLQKKVMVDDRNFAPQGKKAGKVNLPFLIFKNVCWHKSCFVLLCNQLFHSQFKGAPKGKLVDQTSAAPAADVRKTRNLEQALEKEKNSNIEMHLQLMKARDEVSTLRTECKFH